MSLSPHSVTGGVRTLLRLEGAAVCIAALVAYQQGGTPWWWFAAMFLVPDLAMIAYAAGPAIGARAYNAVHSYIVPVLLVVIALLIPAARICMPVALVWLAHIGVDRALGYGLKYASAFSDTHLGRIGRPA